MKADLQAGRDGKAGADESGALQAQFLYNPTGYGFYCHAPTLIKMANGDLLAAWYAYPEEENKGASLVYARKRHGQSEWEPTRAVFGPSGLSAGNPVLFQLPDGQVWLYFVILRGHFWNDAELYGASSSDSGQLWSSPMKLWPARGTVVRHPPVVLQDGSLLLPAYDEGGRESLLLSSRAPYTEWRESCRFAGLPIIQPALIRIGARALALFFRPFAEPRRIWRSFSSDDGANWSAPVRTALPNPLAGLAAFSFGDRIALVYNHTEEHRRYPLSIALSDLTGISWGAPWHLETIEYEVSYPSFLCDVDGQVHGVYSYNRRMIKYVSFACGLLG